MKGKKIELEWMPYELRPHPQPALLPESEYIQRTWQLSVKPLAERLGVPMILPRISPIPRTHLAHEGYQFARVMQKAQDYVDAVFRAYWQEERDIGKIDELVRIAEKIGLDPDAFRKALENRTYQEAHRKALRHAYEEAQIRAVPTMVIGNRILVGLQTKDTLEQVILEQLGP